MKPLQYSPVSLAVATLLMAANTAQAADGSASARVGDLQYGNALDPGGFGAALMQRDLLGYSLLRAGVSRTPTGDLYTAPSPVPEDQGLGDWRYTNGLELGYITQTGDKDAQFFRQYSDWQNGFALSLAWLDMWKPETGDYLEARASYLSEDDNFLRLRVGRYGDFRVEAFYRNMPHTLTTTAFPLWEGIGSDTLTLPANLTPGNSTPADVKAASDAAARTTLRVTRTRAGVSLEGDMGRGFIGYGALTNEQRNGTRLWGGPFFFNYPFVNNGGVMETVRPIDFSTTDVSAGLRRAGKVWRFNTVYSGSFFRNRKTTFTYENPFVIAPVTGTPAAGILTEGQFSLDPNNDAHNLRVELGRTLPQRGDLSLTAALGTMRQNDPIGLNLNCAAPGQVGISGMPFVVNCADWNTPASLSRSTAQARIDTLLLDAKLSFHPTNTFGWHLELRRYDEDNKLRYQAFNPLTGDYGYITLNGSMGTVVPGEMGLFNPNNPAYWSYPAKIGSFPVGYTDTTAELGGDLQMGYRNTLNVTYTFRRYEPDFREVEYTNEHRIQIALTSRQFAGGTLRASYDYATRNGGDYNYFPYASFYAQSLPGFVMPDTANGEASLFAFTTDAMRKFDLSDRDQHKFRLIYTLPVGEATTLSATAHGQYNSYDTQIGRKGDNATGLTLAWDYQPMPRLTLNASASAAFSKMRWANVADNEGLVASDPGNADPTFGGPKYPLANVWNESDRERSLNANLQFTYQWSRTKLDGGYNLNDSRGRLRYDYASISAISATQQAFAATISQFPDTRYRTHSFDLGITQTLSKQWSARLFGRYEHGKFADWHYTGFDTALAYDHRVYTDRGPATDYDAGLVGLMFRYVP
ncbi:MAG: MtrB/PioB family outer membrane beta-barrel protein [Nevskiaceae bacterium]|jgi:hypothetical protein|nr:MtrB/PioB family outer membrane beta-barrel protein [Nevskiaceae bacterium]